MTELDASAAAPASSAETCNEGTTEDSGSPLSARRLTLPLTPHSFEDSISVATSSPNTMRRSMGDLGSLSSMCSVSGSGVRSSSARLRIVDSLNETRTKNSSIMHTLSSKCQSELNALKAALDFASLRLDCELNSSNAVLKHNQPSVPQSSPHSSENSHSHTATSSPIVHDSEMTTNSSILASSSSDDASVYSPSISGPPAQSMVMNVFVQIQNIRRNSASETIELCKKFHENIKPIRAFYNAHLASFDLIKTRLKESHSNLISTLKTVEESHRAYADAHEILTKSMRKYADTVGGSSKGSLLDSVLKAFVSDTDRIRNLNESVTEAREKLTRARLSYQLAIMRSNSAQSFYFAFELNKVRRLLDGKLHSFFNRLCELYLDFESGISRIQESQAEALRNSFVPIDADAVHERFSEEHRTLFNSGPSMVEFNPTGNETVARLAATEDSQEHYNMIITRTSSLLATAQSAKMRAQREITGLESLASVYSSKSNFGDVASTVQPMVRLELNLLFSSREETTLYSQLMFLNSAGGNIIRKLPPQPNSKSKLPALPPPPPPSSQKGNNTLSSSSSSSSLSQSALEVSQFSDSNATICDTSAQISDTKSSSSSSSSSLSEATEAAAEDKMHSIKTEVDSSNHNDSIGSNDNNHDYNAGDVEYDDENDPPPVYLEAIYDYTSSNADEVDLVAGHYYTFIEEEDEETGWTRVATVDGSIGLAPSSYLKPMTTTE